MQWLVLAAGVFAIFTSEGGLEGFLWLIPIAVIIPPLFTIYLYRIWFVDIEENGCMKFTGPLKRKREVLCPEDIAEVEISGYDGSYYVKTIKDRDSNLYPFHRILDRKDCMKIWDEISKEMADGEDKIKIREA